MTRRGLVAAILVVAALVASGAAAGQLSGAPILAPPGGDPKTWTDLQKREAALRNAIVAEPGDLKRYFALADFYKDQEKPGQADGVLRDALNLEPGAAHIFDRRLGLWIKPLEPGRIGSLALEWLRSDGIHPVPVLLAAGYHLRQASGMRGDGSDRSERAIEEGLRIVDGALPANGNSQVPALLFAKSALLMAHSTLVTDAERRKRLVEEAQDLHQLATEPPPGTPPPAPFTGYAAAALGVMSVVPPFGPPGAVRAPAVVPVPKKIKDVEPVLRDRRGGRPAQPLLLEVVIDPAGKVMQIHILRSVEGYDDAVADAVQKWEYEPTLLKGQPQTVIIGAYVRVW